MTCLARFCSPARTSSQITRPTIPSSATNISPTSATTTSLTSATTTSSSSATTTSPSSATLCRWRFYNRRASIRTQIGRFCAQFDVLPAIRTQIKRFCAHFAYIFYSSSSTSYFGFEKSKSINTYFPDNQSS